MTVTRSSGRADVTGVLESRGAVNAAALTFRLSEVRVAATRALSRNHTPPSLTERPSTVDRRASNRRLACHSSCLTEALRLQVGIAIFVHNPSRAL